MQALPLLVGIGPQRSATTWVYELLRLHPQCLAPLAKETHFFSEWYECGVEAFLNEFPKPNRASRVLVDISPEYIGNPFVMDRIKETRPDAKIMVFLRNPYERLISMYSYIYMKSLAHVEPRPLEMLGIPEVLEELTRLLVIAGTCEKYVCEFGRGNVHFFNSEQLSRDPRAEALRIFRFLGIEPYYPVSVDVVVNPSYIVRNPTMQSALGWLSRSGRKLGLGAIVHAVKYAYGARINFGSNPRRPVLPVEELDVLFDHFDSMFEEDTRRLQALSGFDLSHWGRKRSGFRAA